MRFSLFRPYETIARDMAQQIAQLTEKGGADI